MEYAKDEVFKIMYTSMVNNIEERKENIFGKLKKKIKRNKILTICIMAFLVTTILDILMVHHFMDILQNV